MTSVNPKRVRILVFFATNNVSGPGKGLFQLVENIDPALAQFTICNFRHPTQETFEFLEVARRKGIDVQLITQRWALDPLMIRDAVRLARSGEYDVVQSHGYKTHILAWIVAKKLSLPWVALSHGWTAENMKIRVYNALERILLRFPSSAIGVSPDLYSELCKLRKRRRSAMILNAIESSESSAVGDGSAVRARLGVADGDLLIGVFGRLSHEKGQDAFVEAFSRLKCRGSAKAILLGDGHARDRLNALVTNLKLEERVLFLGYQADIIQYFDAIDVCVLPSRSEGLPNVVLEAQLYRCPVIAFTVGGVSETIIDEETGYLVPAGDVDALAGKIDWAFANRKELATTADKARDALFPKFSTERRCAEFVREYNWVVDHLNSERLG